jgi:sugar phosphate isomerase/epimerase
VGAGRVAEGIALAERLGAPMVVLTTGPAGQATWEDAADAFAATIAPLVDQAGAAGVRLVLEHTNSLRADVGFVHTLRDAVDLARGVGLGVCLEVNACWGERALAATIADAVDVLALVQVSDYAIGTTSTPDRLVPGDGDIPLERILGQVLAAGYQGAFELELVGPRIDDEGYASAITRSVQRLGELLDELGA